jgi:hypothetical protein
LRQDDEAEVEHRRPVVEGARHTGDGLELQRRIRVRGQRASSRPGR